MGEAAQLAIASMEAARNASPDAVRPILTFIQQALGVHRVAFVAIIHDRSEYVCAVGVDTIRPGVTVPSLSESVIASLRVSPYVSTPTPGVGWDFAVAIRGGLGGPLHAVLLVDDTDEARHLSSVEQEEMIVCANLLTRICGYDLQYQEMQQQAIRDTLTGLPNRRYIDEVLLRSHAQFLRSSVPFWVAIVDIDFFKKVNDRYGHPFGDGVLKFFAKLLGAVVRSSDHAARIGGEEFMVVGRGNAEAGAIMAKRLCAKMANESEQAVGIQVTVSIGVGAFQADKEQLYASLDEFLTAVDKTLYRAKEEGRNRVCVL